MSLDVFRGLTIVGMLLVNVPGDASAVYTQLRHSAWNGCTIGDLVFPFFLFVVGITTHLSLHSRAARGDSDDVLRRQILRRGALLFAIGLLLNWFPFYQYGAIAGNPSPTFIDHVVARLLELRVLGVLQRIALVYVAAALLTFRAPTKRVVVIVVTILIGYWIVLTLMPVPGQGALGARLLNDPSRTLAAWVDHVTLDWTRWGLGNHIWSGTAVYDPEGLLTTLTAIATTMIGVLAGRSLGGQGWQRATMKSLLAAGALLVVAGLAWSIVFPINKNLWTSSYVLFTAGVACTSLAAIAWLVDAKGSTRWTQPLIVFGVNPLAAYVGAELTAIFFDSTIKFRIDGRMKSLRESAYEHLFVPWMDARLASLAYSLVFVALCYVLLLALYRRRIFAKI